MKRVEGIRAVTYDCWGTLLRDRDWEGAMGIRRSALCSFLGIDEEECAALLDEAWSRHDEAWKQVETFGPGRMAAYCLEARGISDDDSIGKLTRTFEEASMEGGVVAVDGARDVFERLVEANVGLGLVCDTGFTPGRVVRGLLEAEGLLEFLEVLCFSDEVGVPKPGQDIFAKALAGLGARPPEAIHVGDLRRTDIAGARDIGMHPVRFKGVHDDKSDFADAPVVIERHEQLLEVLDLSADG